MRTEEATVEEGVQSMGSVTKDRNPTSVVKCERRSETRGAGAGGAQSGR